MGMSLAGALAPGSVPKRLVLFGAAVALGWIGGLGFLVETSICIYNGFIQIFLEPGFQIASLAMALGLGFLVGLVHITSI